MNTLPALSAPPYRRRLGGLAMLALLRAIAAGTIAVSTRDVFLALSSASVDAPLASPSLVVIAVAGIAIALLRWWEQVEAEHLGQDYAAELRRLLFAHVAHLPAGKLARRRNGGLSLRFVGDLTAVRAWVAQGVARGISAGIVIPVLILVLFHLDARVALGVVIPLGAGLLLMLALGPLLLEAHRLLRQRRGRLAVDMSERLPAAPHLRHLGRLDQEQARLARRSDDMIDASLRRQRRSALIKSVPDAFAGVAVAAGLWVALTTDLPGAVAAGVLAATGMMVTQMRETAGVWDRYCAWRAAKARCEALLALSAVSRPGGKGATKASAQGRGGSSEAQSSVEDAAQRESHGVARPLGLRFRAVCHAGLGPLSFDVPPGAKIGILGDNGSGKSTLLRLAAGLDAPDSGQVETYGPLEDEGMVTREPGRVMLLGPDSPVLAGSVRKALTLGVRPRPRDTVIWRVARRYGLKPLIERLGGLDGSVAEGGRNLSGGEHRRILIARAALSDPDLLLLDEPDDALDEVGRRMIRRFVRESRATVLYVTHDPKQLETLDQFRLLEDGLLNRIGRVGQPSSTKHLTDAASGLPASSCAPEPGVTA